MNLLIKNLKENIFSWLYSVAITAYTMVAFLGEPMIVTLIAIILINTFNYSCFYHFKNLGKKGALYCLLYSLFYLIITTLIVSIPGITSRVFYPIWFFSSNSSNLDINIFFWIGTVLMLSYFYCGTIFYFTSITYRIPVVFLVSLIGFVLDSSKMGGNINFYFLLVVVSFFALYINRTPKIITIQNLLRQKISKWYVLSISIFIACTLLIALITPKPHRIPKIAYIDSFILPIGATIQNAVINQGGRLNLFDPLINKSQSKIGAFAPNLTEEVLFEVKGDEPIYLRIQAWDSYEANNWFSNKEALNIPRKLKDLHTKEEKFSTLVNTLGRVSTIDNSLNPEIQQALQLTSIPQKKLSSEIISKRHILTSYMSTPGIVNLYFGNNSNPEIFYTENLNFYKSYSANKEHHQKYTIDYYSQILNLNSREWGIMSGLNKNNFSVLYNTLKTASYADDTKILTKYENEILQNSLWELNFSYENYTNLPSSISNEIFQLAKTITHGEVSDYKKAKAIEKYFKSEKFIYSYSPPKLSQSKDYTEFFLFESKRGICIHFASAMTILARAAGLPARYVEGYVALERDPISGNYLVRQKDAHAFPEVYIAGYGWMIFEPTVSIAEDENKYYLLFVESIKKGVQFAKDIIVTINNLPVWIKISLTPFILLGIFFLKIVFIKWKNIRWKKRIIHLKTSEALESIYVKILILFRKCNLEMQIHETPLQYSNRINDISQIELIEITKSFNNWKYGEKNPSPTEIQDAIIKYDEVYSEVKKRVSKLKRFFI